MRSLFGTDGIRALAGSPPLDAPTVRRFGVALAQVLRAECGRPVRIVLGRDTRESGPWLRDAVAGGLASAGAVAVDAGVISTPGLAHVVVSAGFDGGVMISASHNPFCDNGLKVFGPTGAKLSDALEARLERVILDPGTADPGEEGPSALPDDTLVEEYVAHLEGLIAPRGRFRGLCLALDCANGAASRLAPQIFRHHGAEVRAIGTSPDGRNINLDCGSLHLARLVETVRAHRCDLGIAFDGDADRALAVDGAGRIVDGDYILYLIARRLFREGRLRGDAVVATILSNLWLEKRLLKEGIALHRAPVGDKYVLERMVEEDLVLGGEQSGHIILREHATTGDGILTGLMLLDALLAGGQPLDSIVDGIEPCPQVQLNVSVRAKPDLRQHPRIGPAVARVEELLRDSGRVILRYSGTEPVARVMVEGPDLETVRAHAERLIAIIGRELG